MTYLAVSIAAKDIDQAEQQINAAKTAGAEMLELRTDYLRQLSTQTVSALIEKAKTAQLPFIVTCRDQQQGGKGDWPCPLRTEILAHAIISGADYIDLEYENCQITEVRETLKPAFDQHPDTGLIISTHNFNGPFTDIELLYDQVLAICPHAIPKLVFTANHINDCFPALDLLRENPDRAIILCMGEPGLITRILAKKLKAFLTFTSIDEKFATAPGQITIQQMKELYRWDAVNNRTQLFGVIGSPIAHSLSPAIFNAAFDCENTNALYLPLLVDGDTLEFNEFLDNVSRRRWLHFKGFSVTIPHKTNALSYVNHTGQYSEELAQQIGAVNTLKIGFNQIVSGYNTDYQGAMHSLLAELNIEKNQLSNLPVAVIGAGGAARAVVAGLTDAGAVVTIYNRTVNKARNLAHEFKCHHAGLEQLTETDAKVIINCTSLGMHPDIDSTPLPQEIIKSDMTIFDTVYNPLNTMLLNHASQAGAATITGAEMFIRQALAQYQIFTGTEPSENIEKTIRSTVFNCLS